MIVVFDKRCRCPRCQAEAAIHLIQESIMVCTEDVIKASAVGIGIAAVLNRTLTFTG